jgi:hypothetical protein
MSLRRFFTIAALVLCCAAPAAAQNVRLEFHDGLVTLSAQNVPLRNVLNEWSRLGGTKIVNGERVPGGLVTLEFNDVPERQALDVLLRSASGYLAGPRPVGNPGASAYASILILATSSAPRPTAGPATPPPIFQPGQRFPPQIPQAVPPPDPDDDPASDVPPNDDPDDEPRPGIQRGRVLPGQPTPPQPFQPDTDQPQPTVNPNTNPFGVSPGSATPGTITPVPQPGQPIRPQIDPEP